MLVKNGLKAKAKKPVFWALIAAAVLCIAVAVIVLTDTVKNNSDSQKYISGQTANGEKTATEHFNELDSSLVDNTTEDEAVNTVLKEPPDLDVVCNKNTVNTLRSIYSWQYNNGDGTATSVNADGNHPTALLDLMTPLVLTPSTLSSVEPFQADLKFGVAPDGITVSSVNLDDETEEDVLVFDEYTLNLKYGNYLYIITADWDRVEYGGTAIYAFYTKTLNN